MNPSGLTPFFDGHNDALLRLFMRKGADAPRAFIDGEGKGQLDLPMAVQGGFAGGLFAIFVPSPKNQVTSADNAAPVSGTAPGAPMPPPLDLTTAQAAVSSMASILIRIEARGERTGPHLPHRRGHPPLHGGRRVGGGAPYRRRGGHRPGV
jgi:membrane dipeptidase